MTSGTSAEMSGVLCDGCSTETNNIARSFCEDCAENLCENCVRRCRNDRKRGPHRLVALRLNGLLLKQVDKDDSSRCELHHDEMLDSFCVECRLAVCTTCMAQKHARHRCVDVEQGVVEQRKLVRKDLADAASIAEDMREERRAVEDNLKDFAVRIDAAESAVTEAAEKLQRLVAVQAGEYLEKLRTIAKEEQAKISEHLERVDFILLEFESFLRRSSETVDCAVMNDAVRTVSIINELSVRAVELKSLADAVGRCRTVDAIFKPAELNELLGKIGGIAALLGELDVVENGQNNREPVDFLKILADNHELLSRSLVVTTGLTAKLRSVEFIRGQIRRIEQRETAAQRTDELLAVLGRVPVDQLRPVFDEFQTALRHDAQEHVANVFRPETDARPMSDEHHQLIVRQREVLCSVLDTTNGLLDELQRRGIFTDRDTSRINGKRDSDAMSQETVEILVRMSDGAFDVFVEALRETGQEHVAFLLQNARGSAADCVPMSAAHRSAINGNLNELCKFLDTESGLLLELFSGGTLTGRDASRVRSRTGSEEKSLELLSILRRKADTAFERFIRALRKTRQDHVVYMLTGEGELRPLSQLRRDVLNSVRDELVSCVDTLHSSLIARLIAGGALNDADKERIDARAVNEDKNCALLDAIARKSQQAYDRFLEALKACGQRQVATALEGLELRGLVKTKFRDGVSTEQRKKVVRILRGDMEALVGGREGDIGALADFMERNGFTVSSVCDGSIRIGFRCFGEQALKNLKRLVADGTLDSRLSEIFCPKFAADDGLDSLRICVDEEEFVRCAEEFRRAAPMSAKHRRVLLRATTLIGDRLRIDDDLLGRLALCGDHREAVCQAAPDERAKTLLEIISCQPDRTFQDLVDALDGTQQQEVAAVLLSCLSSGAKVRLNDKLPVELLEVVLLRTFMKLFADDHKSNFQTQEAMLSAYNTLAGVCYNWWQTMNGWPESRTKDWFRHTLCHRVNQLCRPFAVRPRLRSTLSVPDVKGVTYCDNKTFAVSYETNAVHVFGRDNEKLAGIEISHLKEPRCIVACHETRRLYVADASREGPCVWMVSLAGNHVEKWLPNKSTSTAARFSVYSLSVTSGRLLVTTDNNELLLCGADGVELKQITSPEVMAQLLYATETARGTFVVCHYKPRPQISEVDGDGRLIGVYSGALQLSWPRYLAADSAGRLFVADQHSHRVLLLNGRLELERVLLETQRHGLTQHPSRLCFDEPSGHLLVSSDVAKCVQTFDVFPQRLRSS